MDLIIYIFGLVVAFIVGFVVAVEMIDYVVDDDE